jgi:hypothetical protein|tara:strand:+ start:300 stop:434 length:135 start_codon:yes stop_codon:yes gene_type:complete
MSTYPDDLDALKEMRTLRTISTRFTPVGQNAGEELVKKFKAEGK